MQTCTIEDETSEKPRAIREVRNAQSWDSEVEAAAGRRGRRGQGPAHCQHCRGPSMKTEPRQVTCQVKRPPALSTSNRYNFCSSILTQ